MVAWQFWHGFIAMLLEVCDGYSKGYRNGGKEDARCTLFDVGWLGEFVERLDGNTV